MRRGISRRRVLQGMATGAGLALAGGLRGPQVWAAPGVLGPGSRPDPSKPEGTDLLPEIEHIVIYMQENHSYDSYFGMLDIGDGYTLDAGGNPTNSNPGSHGNSQTVWRATETCQLGKGVGQSWNSTHIQWDHGAMDGFFHDDNVNAMKYWDGAHLPFYWDLARTFVLCDRWFASTPCQTYPNRRYLQAATSVGIVSTDPQAVLDTPNAPNGTIWERLHDHGISWTDYALDLPDILLFPDVHAKFNKTNVKSIPQFLRDCIDGKLPQVSIVSPGFDSYTEENPADVRLGEAYSARIINAVMQSPNWEKTVMLFTYDEHGGYYDHVAPPPAVAPDSIPPDITSPPDQPGGFDMYGFRVPGFVISPFAKKDHVSSTVYDHTSILRLIETKFNLGALTYRDANANDLLDALDLKNPPFLDPPTLAEPGYDGTSACQPDVKDPKLIQPAPRQSTTTTTGVTTTLPGTTTPGSTVPSAPGADAQPGDIAFTGRDMTAPAIVGFSAVATGLMVLAAKHKVDESNAAAAALVCDDGQSVDPD